MVVPLCHFRVDAWSGSSINCIIVTSRLNELHAIASSLCSSARVFQSQLFPPLHLGCLLATCCTQNLTTSQHPLVTIRCG